MHQISKLLGTMLLATATAQVSATTQAEFDKTYQDAQAARKQANSVGGEWRDTAKILAAAKKAAAAGELDKANKMATAALAQGRLGYQQALEQSNPDTTSLFQR